MECRQCSKCFLCTTVEDRGGHIAIGSRVAVMSDRSPVSSTHYLVATTAHKTSVLGCATDPRQTFSLWNLVERLSTTLDLTDTFVLEHSGGVNDDAKGCVAHGHLHLLEAREAFAFERVSSYLSNLGRVIRLESRERFAEYLLQHRLPVNFVWAARPNSGEFLIVDLGSASHEKQVSRRALAAASGSNFVDYEDCIDLPRARHQTADSRAKVAAGDPIRRIERNLPPLVVVEGLVASGKTSISAELAAIVSGIHIASGLYFCALARAALDHGAEIGNDRHSLHTARQLLSSDRMQLYAMIEADATESIRSLASHLAADRAVWETVIRKVIRDVAICRALGFPVIVDGRGLTHYAFEDADASVFLVASEITRKKRAVARESARGNSDAFCIVRSQLARDARDSSRSHGAAQPHSHSLIFDTQRTTATDAARQIAAFIGLTKTSMDKVNFG